ncbi:DNA-directed primase/polymerase protein-like [Copidosoma floridanum]|uniref:DNA-directed primase/polymerase protein-like n=1 Tax=Copidosoma floridanum TaxID=29053 RepID=UPI0006C96850|nr:DNA-directed primase/polymerase protein-like [Copidosoma floridanum]XP_014203753.1 DNA-directed primase/polymerase protein-like [Copidosoma floridanum]
MNNSIIPARFYGHSLTPLFNERAKKVQEAKKHIRYSDPWDINPRARPLTSPSPYKQEFWKQNEALANAAELSEYDDILCCFVFQDENERRRFIVTYPEDFWTDCERMPLEKRVFYEVIPELSPCFLYYDLEFEVDLNPDKDGVRMAQTLIHVTCEYIAYHWKCSCDRRAVINLDSSRPGKFSKHLIFSTSDFAFSNNYHVGYLVKMICSDLVDYVSRESAQHDVLSKFSKESLEELFIETNKGKKLFVDLNVYTKNRHFRVYKATKWGKHSHLQQAPECQYSWPKKPKSKEMEIFLNSLVSYMPRKKKLQLLSFDQDKKSKILSYSQHTEMKQNYAPKEYAKSPYPVLDKYISELIKPGKVRDSKFFEIRQLIIYEIVGFRYCENIGRWHKSNNVYYIVDIVNKTMYQKCHDEDCAGFISDPKRLPVEVTFYFEDECDPLFLDLNDYNAKD